MIHHCFLEWVGHFCIEYCENVDGYMWDDRLCEAPSRSMLDILFIMCIYYDVPPVHLPEFNIVCLTDDEYIVRQITES